MTLLELLVKELPKLGGWPMGFGVISTNSKLDVVAYGWDDVKESTTTMLINIIADEAGIVIKQSYEDAIAEQQPAWNGEGLPPVGTQCEYIGNDTSWGTVKVIGHDEDKVVFKPSGEDYYGITPGNKAVFKPLITEADRKREEVVDAILSLGTSLTAATASIIYDAIAAGKIPGVEISK